MESYVKPSFLQNGHRPEALLRERFVYEERREILKWRQKRKNRLNDIITDLHYEFNGQFVVSRARAKENQAASGQDDQEGIKTEKKGLDSLQIENERRKSRGRQQQFLKRKGSQHIEHNNDSVGQKRVKKESSSTIAEWMQSTPTFAPNATLAEKLEISSAFITKWSDRQYQVKLDLEARKVAEDPIIKKKNRNAALGLRFKGLFSGTIYDMNAKILHSPRRVVNYFGEPGKQELDEKTKDIIDDNERGILDFRMKGTFADRKGFGVLEPRLNKFSLQTSTTRREGYLRDWDIELSGLERYPARAQVATVTRDSERIRLLTSGLSKQTQLLLNKNMNPQTGVTVRHAHISEMTTGLGDRGQSAKRDSGTNQRLGGIISMLVTTSMINGDKDLLSRAYPLLIRMPQTDIRVTWTIGLELLVWRREQQQQRDGEPSSTQQQSQSVQQSQFSQSQAGRTRTQEEQFLEWLIVSFPSNIKIPPSVWKDLPRANDLFPALIMAKLRLNNPKSALEKLEELLLESTFSENPIYHFYMGVAYIQLARAEQPHHAVMPEQKQAGEIFESELNEQPIVGNFEICKRYIRKARDAFDEARRKGGVFPENIIYFEMDLIDEYVENGEVDDVRFGHPNMNPSSSSSTSSTSASSTSASSSSSSRLGLASRSGSASGPASSTLGLYPAYTLFDKHSTLF